MQECDSAPGHPRAASRGEGQGQGQGRGTPALTQGASLAPSVPTGCRAPGVLGRASSCYQVTLRCKVVAAGAAAPYPPSLLSAPRAAGDVFCAWRLQLMDAVHPSRLEDALVHAPG